MDSELFESLMSHEVKVRRVIYYMSKFLAQRDEALKLCGESQQFNRLMEDIQITDYAHFNDKELLRFIKSYDVTGKEMEKVLEMEFGT